MKFKRTYTWQIFFTELVNSHRVSQAVINGKKFWVAAEKTKTFLAIYPEGLYENKLLEIVKKSSFV